MQQNKIYKNTRKYAIFSNIFNTFISFNSKSLIKPHNIQLKTAGLQKGHSKLFNLNIKKNTRNLIEGYTYIYPLSLNPYTKWEEDKLNTGKSKVFIGLRGIILMEFPLFFLLIFSLFVLVFWISCPRDLKGSHYSYCVCIYYTNKDLCLLFLQLHRNEKRTKMQ